jgi:hypothetical protein
MIELIAVRYRLLQERERDYKSVQYILLLLNQKKIKKKNIIIILAVPLSTPIPLLSSSPDAPQPLQQAILLPQNDNLS